jgi:hypothetical protein
VGPRASLDMVAKRKQSLSLLGIKSWLSSQLLNHYTDLVNKNYDHLPIVNKNYDHLPISFNAIQHLKLKQHC